MRNWLGQDIVPGAVVFRGARDGNTSSYKIGVVESVSGGKARVAWKYEPGLAMRTFQGKHERLALTVPSEMDTKGSPDINSLVLVDPRLIERMAQANYFVRQWKDGTLPEHTLRQALDSILGT